MTGLLICRLSQNPAFSSKPQPWKSLSQGLASQKTPFPPTTTVQSFSPLQTETVPPAAERPFSGGVLCPICFQEGRRTLLAVVRRSGQAVPSRLGRLRGDGVYIKCRRCKHQINLG